MNKVIIRVLLVLTLTGMAAAQGGRLHLPPTKDPGAQKAGLLLEQMVQALGGDAYMNLQDTEQVGRVYSFYHGESQGAGALFWRFWKWPDRERLELTKQRDWIVIYSGDKGYDITFHGVRDVEADPLADYQRRRRHSLPWVLRTWLREPGIAVLYEGRGMAERKEAEQVTILNASNDAVTISIDSNTHLPLRVAFSWRDPKLRDLNQDAEGYDNYRPVQGIMTPFSITRYHNGEIAQQRFITETRCNQNLADSLFDPQAAAAQIKKK